jgi:signal transduction histidine kinase
MQQSFAGLYGVIESTDLAALLENAIKISSLGDYSEDIKIERDFAKLLPVEIDSAKLLQILINLLKNARQALLEGTAMDKRITISIQLHDPQTIVIKISDNGIGIAPDIINRIFTQGFTTKASGHGFGLHSCILTAKELKGSLEVSSAGVNQGASFTLFLPYKHS